MVFLKLPGKYSIVTSIWPQKFHLKPFVIQHVLITQPFDAIQIELLLASVNSPPQKKPNVSLMDKMWECVLAPPCADHTV